MRRTACLAIAGVVMVTLVQGGCSSEVDRIGYLDRSDTADGGGTLVALPDAAATDASWELTEYCPSNRCPEGRTTCLNSFFPCDVDLTSDPNNCGACGVSCPTGKLLDSFKCVDGRCVLQCNPASLSLDCDGLPDNGCESRSNRNESCGGCGIQCLDPDRPCSARSPTEYACGCPEGQIRCEGRCIDPSFDDDNCGKCWNFCDPFAYGPIPESMLHVHYGCANGECGSLKCDKDWADCDGNWANGCESSLLAPENCAFCGNSCAPGQDCAFDVIAGQRCACPGNQTFCVLPPGAGPCVPGELCFGRCVDLSSDADLGCGGCGIRCGTGTSTSIPVCMNGVCGTECTTGRSDCNGTDADGCEVNSDSDPRNCGGCGISCDAIAGQACVGGKCVVEPCNQDGGVLPK
jgi:hypothetical protein